MQAVFGPQQIEPHKNAQGNMSLCVLKSANKYRETAYRRFPKWIPTGLFYAHELILPRAKADLFRMGKAGLPFGFRRCVA